jgi:hypothetical protein
VAAIQAVSPVEAMSAIQAMSAAEAMAPVEAMSASRLHEMFPSWCLTRAGEAGWRGSWTLSRRTLCRRYEQVTRKGQQEQDMS